jgi:hypothetical protein
MATELCIIKSTRTAGGIARPEGINLPEIALTAFYGGATDGPCLQLTLHGSERYIELTRGDVLQLRNGIEEWLQTRFRYPGTCEDCGRRAGFHALDCPNHSWNKDKV